LFAKPTPLNINLGSDRFAMFNKKRDIPWQMYSAVTDLAPARSSLVRSEGTVYFREAKINMPAKLAET
jgi:hypothetical protein